MHDAAGGQAIGWQWGSCRGELRGWLLMESESGGGVVDLSRVSACQWQKWQQLLGTSSLVRCCWAPVWGPCRREAVEVRLVVGRLELPVGAFPLFGLVRFDSGAPSIQLVVASLCLADRVSVCTSQPTQRRLSLVSRHILTALDLISSRPSLHFPYPVSLSSDI